MKALDPFTLRDEPAQSCQYATAYFVTARRSAFYGRPSLRYNNADAFHATLARAKHYAESLRKPGSRFEIQEVAALAFPSKTQALIVAEVNNPLPFERFYGLTPEAPTLRHIALFFRPLRPDTLH